MVQTVLCRVQPEIYTNVNDTITSYPEHSKCRMDVYIVVCSLNSNTKLPTLPINGLKHVGDV